jgi:hypothetical protein
MNCHLLVELFSLMIASFRFQGTSEVVLKQTETITNETTFSTKRIWVTVSDSRFVSNGNVIVFQKKASLFSQPGENTLPNVSKTYKGGIFYYIDVPLSTECFRVNSIDEKGNAIYQTDWVCDILPSYLYEVTSAVNGYIRARSSDLEAERHPDSKILGLLLSSYITFSPSYENGFAAYPELQTLWISKYIGELETVPGPDLSSTYIFDYTLADCENPNPQARKTRLVSVEDKISELGASYKGGVPSKKLTSSRDSWLASGLLVVCSLLTFGVILSYYLIAGRKNEKFSKKIP